MTLCGEVLNLNRPLYLVRRGENSQGFPMGVHNRKTSPIPTVQIKLSHSFSKSFFSRIALYIWKTPLADRGKNYFPFELGPGFPGRLAPLGQRIYLMKQTLLISSLFIWSLGPWKIHQTSSRQLNRGYFYSGTDLLLYFPDRHWTTPSGHFDQIIITLQ